MTQRCDAIVIGAGQAGPSLAMRLGQEGLDTVLVERRHLGGSCVNFGCTPTKAMVASARAAWMARRAHELGVRVDGEVRVDMRAVKRRGDAIVEQSRSGLQDALSSTQHVTLIDGHARFIGPRRIQVGNAPSRPSGSSSTPAPAPPSPPSPGSPTPITGHHHG
jgi:pyruvate/2-oxoglutarate dehydrogenase complex dihydrolipoamide dehydrogenase (E3) component